MKLLRRITNQSWQKVKRNRHLVAIHLELDDAQYRLWDLLVALYDWDRKHEETYGCVECTDREIAKILSWSPAKVCRARNELLKKKVIRKPGDLYSILPFPELDDETLNKFKKVARVHGSVSPLKPHVSPPIKELAPLQQNQGYLDKSSLVSYKDESSNGYPKKVLIKQESRTEEEYKRIKEEMGPSSLEIDDMKWIDDNLVEKKVVDGPATEKDIVDIFFAGNWENYKGHLISE